MGLVTTIGAVVLALLGLFWVSAKLMVRTLQADSDDEKNQMVHAWDRLFSAFQLVLVVVLLLELGPPVAAFLVKTAIAVIQTLL